ncbi:hypothetical protein [Streptomyces sp. NRRL S-118]|uniref:hypothetical protein n=1 Tax=Streptomyces sp. NRRL S-118 TaxID=1463881 RepID=UPI000A40B9BA|nr:hypothetical protein [Streptomyces sp. NRRL S-118]
MSSLYSTHLTSGYGVGHLLMPSEESVPHPAADPPIYRALLRHWAGSGRTVPGRRDQEWARLTATPAWTPLGVPDAREPRDPRG